MTLHDLTQRYWGHDIQMITRPDENNRQRVCIFLSARIAEGDEIIVKGIRSTGRYRVVSDVDRPMDPGDQHFCTVERIA